MGKASREKGARGEREIAALLRSYGFDGHRGRQYNGADGSPDVYGLPGWHIEVKRTEALRLWDAVKQAESDAREGEKPVVMHRRNGSEWLAIMKADDFLELVKDE